MKGLRKKMKKISFLIIALILFIPGIVKADTYTTTENLFENTYTNNLIDMAATQIDNFTNKYYAIIQVNYDYYLFAAEKNDVTINDTQISMQNTEIIRAIRTQNGYNYYYDYSTSEETSTSIYLSHIAVSNLTTSKSITGKRFEEYKRNTNITSLLMFILGLVFAIFLTKERSY